MTDPPRSPFGELLKRYRDERGLTQDALARRIARRNQVDADVPLVSGRTIAGLEGGPVNGRWRQPRKSTVLALADALELEPGTAAREAFIAAANAAATSTGTGPPAVADLPPELLRILVVASVQGSEFWGKTTMAVLGLTPAQWIDRVDEQLVRQHHVLVSSGTKPVGMQVAHFYAFADAKLRDELYTSHLTDLERAHYHRATAEAMIDLFGDEPNLAAAQIARHHEQSHERERAARAWIQAGIHAFQERSFSGAIDAFTRVGELGARQFDRETYIRSLVWLGNSERGAGHRNRSRQHLQRAVELAAAANLTTLRAHALEALAILDFDAGDMDTGAQRLEAVVELLLDAGNETDAAHALGNQSYLLAGVGEYDRARAAAARSVQIATRIGNDTILVDALFGLGIFQIELGHYDDARTTYRQCVDLSVQNQDSHREQLARHNLSICAFERQDWQTARDEAQHIVDALGDRDTQLVSMAALNLGIVAEGLGDLDTAGRHYARSLAIRERDGLHALAIDSLAGTLRVAVARGDRATARALLDDVSGRVDHRGLHGIEHVGRLYVTLVEASRWLGDAGAARRHAQAGVAELASRAARLASIDDRISYLNSVASHARLLHLAQDLGLDELVASTTALTALAPDWNTVIDHLPEELQQLLRVASVQGDTFVAEVLIDVVQIPPVRAIDLLDHRLVREQRLLQPAACDEIANTRVHRYRFVDANLRTTIYEGMTSHARSHHHIATAEAITSRFGQANHSGLTEVATQLEAAGSRQRAAVAWVAAATWAFGNDDRATARTSYQHAAGLARRADAPAPLADALIGVANVARAEANPALARSSVERALAIARRRHLPEITANALSLMGVLDYDAGHMTSGATRHTEAIDAYLEAGNRQEAARSMANLSYVTHGMGRFHEAFELAERSLALAQEVGDDESVVDATIAAANCWLDLGRYADALSAYEGCRAICDDIGDVHRDNICLLNISLCCLDTGAWERGAETLTALHDPARPVVDRFVATAEFNMGLIGEARGDPTGKVRECYERALAIRVEGTQQQMLVIDTLAGLTRVALAEGNPTEARDRLREVEHLIETHGTYGIEHLGRLFVTQVEVWQALGDDDAARERAARALAVVGERAAALANAEHRSSYLSNVPANRRILELAASFGLVAG